MKNDQTRHIKKFSLHILIYIYSVYKFPSPIYFYSTYYNGSQQILTNIGGSDVALIPGKKFH